MLYILILIIIIIIGIIAKIKNNQNNNNKNKKQTETFQAPQIQYQNKMPYRKKYLLTKNEWYFYKKLKQVTDKYGMCILSKIRLADIVEVIPTNNKREWNTYFAKIKSKHIDFALANAENLKIMYLIELDDSSHQKQNRIERDNFVDELCKITGYKLIHTYGEITYIENIIAEGKSSETVRQSPPYCN